MPCLFSDRLDKTGNHMPKAEKEKLIDGRQRCGINPGMLVRIELKKDQGTGKLTEGKVKEILTGSSFHPHGIKVRLDDGQVGRVKQAG
jgi:uncharacterized repeat protein (TIGR03833 family)